MLLLVVSLLAMASRSEALAASSRPCSGVVVVGTAGGAAESLAVQLSSGSLPVSLLLDRPPCSPLLQGDSKLPILCGLPGGGMVDARAEKIVSVDWAAMLSNRVVVAVEDNGNAKLREEEEIKDRRLMGVDMLTALSKVIPNDVVSVVCAMSVDEERRNRGVFKRGAVALRETCQQKQRTFAALRYGQLLGGVVGAEPVPFKSLPLLEPELDDSFVLTSVLCSTVTNEQYAAAQPCTRDSLATALAKIVQASLKDASMDQLDALLVSIAGPKPSDADWDKLLGRLRTSQDNEIFRVDFGAVKKPEALLRWLAETWFPSALVDADAATILSGARPVRAVVDSANNRVRIEWEDLRPDLSILKVGSLELVLVLGEQPRLVARRNAQRILPGETQLLDRLLEGINKTVYKRDIATPAVSEAVAGGKK